MALQLILCMETKKSAATDYIYIRDTINKYYECNNKIRITPVYMNSKSRYNSNSVKKEIKKYIKDYTIGDTKVIYCVDTDLYETNMDHARELLEIENYCAANGYELIWFCHDVEEVYLGKRISANQKVIEAVSFRKKKMIENMKINTLANDVKRKGISNIILVLDKYLDRIKF